MNRRVWKWVLGLAAGTALALAALLWSAHSRATAAFERHDALVKESIAALRSRTIARAPLSDQPLPGDGRPAIVAVFGEFDAMADASRAGLPSFVDAEPASPDREKVDALLQKFAPLIDRVRQADRYRDWSPAFRYEDGWAVDLPGGVGSIRAAQFFRDRAHHLYQGGSRAEALESILLGLSVAHDTGRGGGLDHWAHQLACEGIVSYFVRKTLESHAFTVPELEVFARKLDQLWLRRPTLVDALRVEDVLDRRSLLNLEYLGNDAPATVYQDREVLRGRSFRYLYSRRLTYAGALDELEQLYRKSLQAADQPEAAAKVRSDLEASRNPVVRRIGPDAEGNGKADLSARMQWMLLRTAVAVAWFEAEQGKFPGTLADLVPKHLPEVPACPRTRAPLVTRGGNVWWVGRNGVDDGGKPGLSDDETDEDGDAVWRVKRK